MFRTESWPDKLEQRSVELEPPEISHARARRLPEGAGIYVGDGQGRRWPGRLHWAGKKQAFVTLEGMCENRARSATLDLMVAVPRGSRNDWLIEKSTELGLRRLIPAEFERSVREKISADRFYRLGQEAAAQSEAWYLPSLENPVSFADLESYLDRELSRGMYVHILDLPDENVRNSDPRKRGDENNQKADDNESKTRAGPGVARSKSGSDSSSSPFGAEQWSPPSDSNQWSPATEVTGSNAESELLIVIGPEGGFGPKDQRIWDSLCRKWPDRCRRVYLGPMVLRVETAAIAYLSYQRISRVSKESM